MKNKYLVKEQISIFDLPVIENVKPKEIIIEKEQGVKSDKLDHIIRVYLESCSRIVKTLSGALIVELYNKTLYFNAIGINEFNLPNNVGIMPGEEILIVNIDKEINEMQKQKLEDLEPKQYIKRKGDANLIISGEKTIVINPKGWVLEYDQKPRYNTNEIFDTEFNLKIDKNYDRNNEIAVDNTDIDFNVDDEVNIEYQGVKAIGKVARIYNSRETLNVRWDGKQTAFYYKNVKKNRLK